VAREAFYEEKKRAEILAYWDSASNINDAADAEFRRRRIVTTAQDSQDDHDTDEFNRRQADEVTWVKYTSLPEHRSTHERSLRRFSQMFGVGFDFETPYRASMLRHTARTGIAPLDAARRNLRRTRNAHGEEEAAYKKAHASVCVLVLHGLRKSVTDVGDRLMMAEICLFEAALAASEHRIATEETPDWVCDDDRNAAGEFIDDAETFFARLSGDTAWWKGRKLVHGADEQYEENLAFYVAEDEEVAAKQCAVCGATSPEDRKGGKMLRCSRCKLVYYCGAACQKADWKAAHKRECTGAKK